MLTYGFRVRFRLPSDTAIQEDSKEIELMCLPDGRTLMLCAISSIKISDTHDLGIRAGGFTSEHEANMYGQRTKTALMICGVYCGMGIDVGKDKATSGVGKKLRESAREAGILLLNDVHGLSVFPEDLPVRFCSMSARVVIGGPTERFKREFCRAFESARDLSNKQMLSLELYAASKFEVSPRARFLTLISAVEALVESQSEKPEIVGFLDYLIRITDKRLTEPDRGLLTSRLGDLKSKSISGLCKEYVKGYLGEEEAKLFSSAYGVRSKILHEGDVPAGIDLGSLCPKVDGLVSELLEAVCIV